MAHTMTHRLAGKRMVFHTDNIPVMAILNNASSKKPEIMKMVRPLMLLFLKNNFIATSI